MTRFRALDGLTGVSIHAPVKGRPATAGDRPDSAEVSIHAPVKGATRRRRW